MATVGVGMMAEGLAKLKDVDMLSIGLGIAAIGAGAMASTLGLVGLAGMTASVLAIASTSDDMQKVGNAFGNISAVMKGTSSDLESVEKTVNAISSMDIEGNSGIASLADALSRPLRVEFADKEVAFVANIDLNVDGKKFMDAANINENIKVKQNDANSGKGGK